MAEIKETRAQKLQRGISEKYDELFPDSESKAEAFDLIAQNYYFGNFGTMQKSDFDVLMFSIYLERILDRSEKGKIQKEYSDYELSKLLGITQSRIRTLKVKKELKYPYDGFDWRESLLRIIGDVRYENGKIKIPISDQNLFLEVKNAIEESGGYIEVQLNSKLLQISPEYFLDLMILLCDDDRQQEIKEEILKKIVETEELRLYFEKDSEGESERENNAVTSISFGKKLKGCAPKIIETAIPEILSCFVPVLGSVVKVVIEELK